MAPGQYVVLPSNASCQYIAEGAANVVYRISVPPGTPPESNIESYGPGTPPPTELEGLSWHKGLYNPFEGKLLRVRKDLPTTVPCEVSHDKWIRLIAPMFPDDQIINQTLVELKSSKIIDRLNQELKGLERPKIKESPSHIRPFRPLKRNGIYLANDNHGLLVTDMSISGDGETLMEFKPKWLAQSPSAPAGSLRCRGCAKFAKCNAESASNGRPLSQAYFCPLDLISGDSTAINSAARQLAGPEAAEKNTKKVAQWLKKTKLLENLRNLQKLDRKGVMKADVTDENFLVAMTLRDCSVFVRLPDNDDVPIEARIGDLDLKSPDKAEYWKSVERPLIEEGWYRWEEKGKDRQPNFCALNKHR